MNPIEEQRKIIDQLYKIVLGSCPENAETASCRFDLQRFEDGSASVGQQFEYRAAGLLVSAALDRALRAPVMGLVKQLHTKMKAHTGGDWQAFTLTINRDGSVTTKFEYPQQEG
ncbi:hypothetical protein ACQKGL_27495 [Ensifer adhaerens]|uniref:hypothetical protein n=1 Tax=Ensifer adhaerens TaxID=106592 RepID=UPI003D04D47F